LDETGRTKNKKQEGAGENGPRELKKKRSTSVRKRAEVPQF